MAYSNNSRKWHEGMDALLARIYSSGKYSVGEIAEQIGVSIPTIYAQMRRLRLPLLNNAGCALRDYRSYGPRYNQVIFSKRQIALLVRLNKEGWHDSKIARTLRIQTRPVRNLRKKLGLPAHIYKPIPPDTRYGNLVVIRALPPRRKRGADAVRSLSSRSLCRCDCGKTRIVFNEDLRSGNTKTCGCRIDLRNLDSEWIRVFHSCRSSAASRGLKFQLSLSQVKLICSLPCYYCGAKASNRAIPPKHGHPTRTPLSYNGIDQVVPCRGYRLGNVLPCCSFCNRAKANLPLRKFLGWLNRLFERRLTTHSLQNAARVFGHKVRIRTI